MSIVIGNGSTGELVIDPTSQSARALLYDPSGNVLVRANNAAAPATQYAVPIAGVDHDSYRITNLDKLGRQETPSRRLVMTENCEGATLNSQRWQTTLTGQTATQSATGIVLNSGSSVTATTGTLLTSRQQFARFPLAGLMTRIRARSTLVANQVAELGFGFSAALSATTSQVENGAHWRINSDGTVTPVLIYNSTEVTGTDISGSLSSANYYDYYVMLEDDRVTFVVTRSDTGAEVSRQVLRNAITAPKLWSVTHAYEWIRCRNNTAPLSAGQLIVTDIEVYQLDVLHNESLGSQLSDNTLNATLNPTAFTQAQQFANSTNPANATLGNGAASYSFLGGIYSFAAVANANTDFPLFGYTVPAPYRLRVTGVHISMINAGAANAATPATTLMWGLGLNGASGNLGTAGHIRRLVGVTSIPISAAIGAASPDIDVAFPQPLICEQGLNFAVIMRVMAGAATASQVIQGVVDVRGYFE